MELETKFVAPGGPSRTFDEAATTPQARGNGAGEWFVLQFGPLMLKVHQSSDRAEQVERNLHVAFALAAYQRDHGAYPAKLDELAPKYLASVPLDLFTGKALVYGPAADGYLLYSCGPDGRDDLGRTEDDAPSGDDIAVRMPLPPRK